MKKIQRFVWLIISSLPLLVNGQTDSSTQGIQWIRNLSWEQVKAKAKKERKYVFVDCYTTWCGPCRGMDLFVYPDKKLSGFNNKFVSVKVQMDTTAKDNQNVKKWYKDARYLLKTFNVVAYPSYLFFSPDGKLVHKDEGYKGPDELLIIAETALDPEKQLYTLLEKYKIGKLQYSSMPHLANMVKSLLRNEKLAQEIASNYLKNYLYKTDPRQWITVDQITFLVTFVKTTKEKGFKFFKNHKELIDEVTRQNFSYDAIDYIILRSEINPLLWKNNKIVSVEPDWNAIESKLKKNYPYHETDHIVLNARLTWHDVNKNWDSLAKYNIKKIEKYGLDTAGMFTDAANHMFWEVFFLHTTDKSQLEKAIKWMEIIVIGHPNHSPAVDTYANLLYKVGRVEEAIAWQEKVVAKNPENEGMRNALQNMRKGLPTYVELGAVWENKLQRKASER